MFGLRDIVKGTYPYRFNTKVNWTHIGEMPSFHWFLPEGCDVTIDQLKQWKQTGSPNQEDDEYKLMAKFYNMYMHWQTRVDNHDVFNNLEELKRYCIADVLVLLRGLHKFRQQFRTQTETTLHTRTVNQRHRSRFGACGVSAVWERSAISKREAGCAATESILRDVATTTSYRVTSFDFGIRRKSSAQLVTKTRCGRFCLVPVAMYNTSIIMICCVHVVQLLGCFVSLRSVACSPSNQTRTRHPCDRGPLRCHPWAH